MNISIFGLGYVGCVSLGCLAKNGHNVIGVDTNQDKIDLINIGLPTIIEKDIDKIISETFVQGKIKATQDYEYAVVNSEVSIICVGTPSTDQGHIDLSHIYATANQIGSAIREKKGFHIIAIRSTVLPGTNEEVGKLIEKTSNKKRNDGFAIISNPEFMREGTAVTDFYNPPLIVVGCDNDKALNQYLDTFEGIDTLIEKTSINTAEIIKYINNSFHALKIVFANEIGNICKKLDIDSHEAMRIFCIDTQLNISPNYLKPGSAYGGSCLPKDIKTLNKLSQNLYLSTPILSHLEVSNNYQKNRALERIERIGKLKILIMGISFKAGTDDLRNSPGIYLVESLIEKGYELRVFDKNINLSKLIGDNISFINESLPHIDKILVSNIEDSLSWSEIIVINNYENDYEELEIPDNIHILDFVRINKFEKHPLYDGFLW